MRILGIDFGSRRIGLALSDELEVAAHPLQALERDGQEVDRIVQLVRRWAVGAVVVGLPVRMDGTEGTQARRVRGFVKDLRRRLPEVEIETVDERLTTAQAERALQMLGMNRRQRREHADTVAAQLILQRYLEARRRRRAEEGPLNEQQ